LLFDFSTGRQITRVPYEAGYRRYLSRMSDEEIAAIRAALNEMIEGTEIQTAGWMPGHNWQGTVFFPIYEKAARRDYYAAAKCFGLMVWEVFMNRPEEWFSGRFEKSGEPIGSRTYFRSRH
jgi:hypothetical protein